MSHFRIRPSAIRQRIMEDDFEEFERWFTNQNVSDWVQQAEDKLKQS